MKTLDFYEFQKSLKKSQTTITDQYNIIYYMIMNVFSYIGHLEQITITNIIRKENHSEKDVSQ